MKKELAIIKILVYNVRGESPKRNETKTRKETTRHAQIHHRQPQQLHPLPNHHLQRPRQAL